MEPKTDAPPVVERPKTKEEIVDFLGLQDARPESDWRKELGISRDKILPWWLEETQTDSKGQKIKGPIDPVSKLRADLKTSPARSLSIPLIYRAIYSANLKAVKEPDGSVSVPIPIVPPYSEMVTAATDILHQIGFNPKPIQGNDWIIPEPANRTFPTIFDDIEVNVVRDKDGGKVTSVYLIGHK